MGKTPSYPMPVELAYSPAAMLSSPGQESEGLAVNRFRVIGAARGSPARFDAADLFVFSSMYSWAASVVRLLPSLNVPSTLISRDWQLQARRLSSKAHGGFHKRADARSDADQQVGRGLLHRYRLAHVFRGRFGCRLPIEELLGTRAPSGARLMPAFDRAPTASRPSADRRQIIVERCRRACSLRRGSLAPRHPR